MQNPYSGEEYNETRQIESVSERLETKKQIICELIADARSTVSSEDSGLETDYDEGNLSKSQSQSQLPPQYHNLSVSF